MSDEDINKILNIAERQHMDRLSQEAIDTVFWQMTVSLPDVFDLGRKIIFVHG